MPDINFYLLGLDLTLLFLERDGHPVIPASEAGRVVSKSRFQNRTAFIRRHLQSVCAKNPMDDDSVLEVVCLHL